MSAAPPPGVRVRVPAKVNLQLGVGELRADGFHELVSVFHAVDLYDEITVRVAPTLSVRMRGEGADELPTDAGNLAWRAAELVAARAGVSADVAIEIDKAIPVAGGMAGGSADAAGTLLACAHLWGLDPAQVTDLAPELGSDVAFILLGNTALGTGRGERLTPVPVGGPLHWVFVLADFGISSGAAYRELDRLRERGDGPGPSLDASELVAALATGDPTKIAQWLVNDLEAASLALAPDLRAVLAAGRASGALAGFVSGSGPTCAFLCSDADAAADVAAGLAPYRTVLASGQVPGAVVLD